MAVASPPSCFMARAILIPPPPGSSLGAAHLNFLSGTKAGMEVLLSIQGLKVIVIMECMVHGLICSGLLSSMFQKEILAGR